MSLESRKEQALPVGWASASADELASQVENALTIGPFGSDLKVSDYRDSGVPLIFVRNIRSGDFAFGRKFVERPKAQQLRRHLARPGDILITKMGDPPGDACLYPLSEEPAVITADCIKWTLNPCVGDATFFVYAIRSPRVRKAVAAMTGGVAQQKISLERFRGLRIPVAPVGEQRRIVSEIDKQFSRLDAAVAALKRAQANLKRYRAAVLQAAVEGRLVATEAALARRQGRPDQAGHELFQLPSPAGRQAKRTPSWPLPEGWTWATVDQVAEVQLGRQRSPQHHAGPHMRPYLRAANVTWGGLDLTDVMEMNFDAADFERHRLLPGDLLLAEASGSASEVGKPALWRGEIADCCCQNTLIRVRPRFPIAPFLFWHVYCDALRGRFGDASRGVGIHHLGSAGLASWVVGIPPLREQVRIVAELERRWSVLSALESGLAEALARSQVLRRTVLSDAFAGRLVPQDPHDEPASVLLERIQSERGTTATRKPTTRRKPAFATV